MFTVQTICVLLLLISSAIGIGLLSYLYRRREIPGATAMMILAGAISIWSLTYSLELGVSGFTWKIFAAKLQYIGITIIPLAWFQFAEAYSRRNRWTRPHHIAVLAVLPAITLILVFSNEYHQLIWKDVQLNIQGPLQTFDATYGPAWYIFAAYSYALLFWGGLILLLAARALSNVYRRQFYILLFSLLLPWVANVLYIARLSPVQQLDLGPFAVTFSAAILTYGMSRYRLFDLTPVSRSALIHNIPKPAFIVDMKGRVVDVNLPVHSIILFPVTNIIGLPVEKVFPWWPSLDGESISDVATVQNVCIQQDKHNRYFNLHVTPVLDHDQSVIGRLIILDDITIEKLAQEALALARVKSEFLAKVGHELRTPLTSILGVAEMLEYGVYGPLSEEQRSAIRLLFDSTHQMTRLVNDILLEARIEHGVFKLEITDFSMSDIVDHLNAQLRSQAEKKGIDFIVDLSPELPARQRGDPTRIYQILYNLVENAIKYTPAGEVRVTIAPSLIHDRYLFEVADTGIGIPSNMLQHIFEAFHQVGLDKKQEQQGLGLGLSIVKQLVQLMGGEISVESDIGKGSVFKVELPLERVIE